MSINLCKDLDFSEEDRIKNLKRLGKQAIRNEALCDIIIIAAISHYETFMHLLKLQAAASIIWLQYSRDVLTQRDTKGLYQSVLWLNNHSNKITNLIGIQMGTMCQKQQT